jgi:predicted phosphodiesterase
MTKILIISDIHANLNALETVLDHAGKVDEVWCLGDLVGYGPQPNECIQLIRSLPTTKCLLGNHDAAAIGMIDLSTFNREAGISAIWTQRTLSQSSLEFLKSLPEKIVLKDSDATIVHGSPRNPVWEYLLDIFSATENLAYFDTQLCLVGHTHLPLAYIYAASGFAELGTFLDGDTIQITRKSIFNPGSVGQPRDQDPRAAYAIYCPESRTFEAHRVQYDIQDTQKKIIRANLPRHHAERLEHGW